MLSLRLAHARRRARPFLLRRSLFQKEKDVVAAYYAELKALNPLIGMMFEQCWNEYVMGGLGRWLFFLPFNGFYGR